MKKKATRLICVLVSVFLMLSFSFPAFASDAEQNEGGLSLAGGYDYERFRGQGITLNVYNWGEYISDGTDSDFLDVNAEFEALTGISVNYATYETNESLYAKLKSGGADYDIIIPSDYMIGKMIEEDMLAPLNFENIPNFAMIGETYKGRDYDPNNEYSVAYTWGVVGLIYNTTMVEEPVDSWSILWSERYSEQILMFDNSRDAFGLSFLAQGLPLNPESIEQIDEGTAALIAQRPLVQAYVMDQIFDKMQGGEAALAPYYAGDAVLMSEVNPDLNFVVPKEGTNYFVDAMCVPATSQNKEAAEMYINFMCETEVALSNCQFIGYSTPQVEAEAALPPEIRNNPWLYPPQDVLNNTWTYSVLPDELKDYLDLSWNNMRTSSGDSAGWVIFFGLILSVVVIVVNFVLRFYRRKKNLY